MHPLPWRTLCEGGRIVVLEHGDLRQATTDVCTADFSAPAVVLTGSGRAGPGALTPGVTVRNDDTEAAGGMVTVRASAAIAIVGSTIGRATVAPDRIDTTWKGRHPRCLPG